MLNKKLLSEIFGEEVDYVDVTIIHKKTGHFLPMRFKNGNYHEMPVAYIVQKCKEQIREQKYNSSVVAYLDGSYRCRLTQSWNKSTEYNSDADTEHDAVFKAYVWILERKARHDSD